MSNFNPATLPGTSFFDAASGRNMRYIYPKAQSQYAGWLLVQNPSGDWMTLRKPNLLDIEAINKAVVMSHHSEKGGTR